MQDPAQARAGAGSGRGGRPRPPPDAIDLAEKTATALSGARQAAPQAAKNAHCRFGFEAGAAGGSRSRAAVLVRQSYVARRPREQIIREENQLGDYPLRHACRNWCRATSRRAIPTTRPASSIPCSAPTRCCSTLPTCPSQSRSTSTAACAARKPFIVGIMEQSGSRHSSGDRLLALPPHSLDACDDRRIGKANQKSWRSASTFGRADERAASLKDGDILRAQRSIRGTRSSSARCRRRKVDGHRL